MRLLILESSYCPAQCFFQVFQFFDSQTQMFGVASIPIDGKKPKILSELPQTVINLSEITQQAVELLFLFQNLFWGETRQIGSHKGRDIIVQSLDA